MLSRRSFLISGMAATGFAALQPMLSWAAQPNVNSDIERFYRLSLLLTGRNNLSRIVTTRALHALSEGDADFPQKIQQLASALSTNKISDINQLNGHPIMQSPDGDTIKKIISAWYLGYTGTPVSLRATDSTRFVTYTDALMFEPTLDATVIPTYSRGHTNYWTQPPATLNND
jgi:hypothetical protein